MGHAETAAKLIDAGAQVDLQNKVRECGRACSSCWRSKSMCIYVRVCVHDVCVRVCVCLSVFVCVYVFACVCFFCVCVEMSVFTYSHVCVSLSLSVYIYSYHRYIYMLRVGV